MKEKIIIIGSGGHAQVIMDILNQRNDIEVCGVTSISMSRGADFCGVPVLGNDSDLMSLAKEFGIDKLAMGIGGFKDNNHRTQLYDRLVKQGFSFTNIIHPQASISPTVTFGEGVTIYPGAIINTKVTIGNNVIIASGVVIDHEAIIGDNVLLSTGVKIGGYSTVHKNALIALGANVVAGVQIGADVVVAAGAVVTQNIPAGLIVYGIPAKPKPKM